MICLPLMKSSDACRPICSPPSSTFDFIYSTYQTYRYLVFLNSNTYFLQDQNHEGGIETFFKNLVGVEEFNSFCDIFLQHFPEGLKEHHWKAIWSRCLLHTQFDTIQNLLLKLSLQPYLFFTRDYWYFMQLQLRSPSFSLLVQVLVVILTILLDNHRVSNHAPINFQLINGIKSLMRCRNCVKKLCFCHCILTIVSWISASMLSLHFSHLFKFQVCLLEQFIVSGGSLFLNSFPIWFLCFQFLLLVLLHSFNFAFSIFNFSDISRSAVDRERTPPYLSLSLKPFTSHHQASNLN